MGRERLLLLCWLVAGCTHETDILGNPDFSIDPGPDLVETLPDPVDPPPEPDIIDVPDVCPDSDGDGVCDSVDRCPGHDDAMDWDGDGVPDGCDACPGGDDRMDTDGDGVPDYCDCDHSVIECDVNATCIESGGPPTCVCNPGYAGDGFTCTDIDECATGTHGCDVNATCTNTAGSYICACNEGYEGDGYSCTPIDHCMAGTSLCDPNATCTYTGPGTYDCACNPGYLGDGFVCTPIDPDVCISVNDGPLFDDSVAMTGTGRLLGLKFTLTSSVRITRCEVFTGETAGTATIGIWSHDYTTNRPYSDLGTAGWSMLSTNQWQGPVFSPPVFLGAGPIYWVVWGPVSGSQASLQVSGSMVENRTSFDGGSTWSTLDSSPYKYRCFCE